MGIKKGDKVSWNWGKSAAEGTVKRVFDDDVEIDIKGTKVKRNASSKEPAYLIEQEDGDKVLKSVSELNSQRK